MESTYHIQVIVDGSNYIKMPLLKGQEIYQVNDILNMLYLYVEDFNEIEMKIEEMRVSYDAVGDDESGYSDDIQLLHNSVTFKDHPDIRKMKIDFQEIEKFITNTK